MLVSAGGVLLLFMKIAGYSPYMESMLGGMRAENPPVNMLCWVNRSLAGFTRSASARALHTSRYVLSLLSSKVTPPSCRAECW